MSSTVSYEDFITKKAMFLALPGSFVSIAKHKQLDWWRDQNDSNDVDDSEKGIVESVLFKPDVFNGMLSPAGIVLKQRIKEKNPITKQKMFRLEKKTIPLRSLTDSGLQVIGKFWPLTITTFDGIGESTVGTLASKRIKVITDDANRFPVEIGTLIYQYDDAAVTAGWEGYDPNPAINPLMNVHKPKEKKKSVSIGCSRTRQIEKIKAQQAEQPK